MSNRDTQVTYFAAANHRGILQPFGIRQSDRHFHMYAIGKTGVGKSTLLKTLILQDLEAGRGFCAIDPHGDLVEEIMASVPTDRRELVTYLNTPEGTWTFNPLDGIASGHESLAVAELIEVFRKLWIEDWGPRLEHLLRNVLFTLIEVPGSTLADAMRLISNEPYRKSVARQVANIEVREFWTREFAHYSPAFRAVVVAPLQNKLGALLTDPRMKAIIGEKKSSFDLREIMDQGKVLLVNLSRGQIGEGPAAMLGALLSARIGLVGLARADRAEADRRDFGLYLDEVHLYATESLAGMLAELRKYRVYLVLANQFTGQLEPAVRDAILGNVGTLIVFRVSAPDAELLAKEFEPVFHRVDLVTLPNHHIYLRLMIDAQVSKPFSATTMRRVA